MLTSGHPVAYVQLAFRLPEEEEKGAATYHELLLSVIDMWFYRGTREVVADVDEYIGEEDSYHWYDEDGNAQNWE